MTIAMRASFGWWVVGLASVSIGCQCTEKVKTTDGVLRVNPTVVDFGTVAPLTISERTLTFLNAGTFGLDVVVESTLEAPFELVGLSTFHLDPSESTTRVVRFQSAVSGAFASALAGSSSSRTGPSWSVPLTAVVLRATPDGGAQGLDGGAFDGGAQGPDAGSATFDAGSVGADAGRTDAGSVVPDAGCFSSTAFSFAAPLSFDGGNQTRQLVTGDFNRDGRTDLALLPSPSATAGLEVMLATGAGTFGPRVTYAPAVTAAAAATGDFNRDGTLDLALAASSGKVEVLLGDGAGGFGGPTPFQGGAGGFYYSIAAADLNRDGTLDRKAHV